MSFDTEVQQSVPPRSPQEEELLNLNLQQARLQSQLTPLQIASQSPELALAGGLPGVDINQFSPAVRDLLQREAARSQQARAFDQLLQDRTEARLRGESFLTPEQERLVEQTFQGARLQGEEDITRFADELSGGRGLRLTDTPIGGEALRQRRRLEESLRSAEAGAKLDFGTQQQSFTEGLRQFQEGLRQQAFVNRLGLTSGLTNPLALQGTLQQGRLANVTQTTSPGFGQSFFGTVLPGIGSLTSGIGGALKAGAG